MSAETTINAMFYEASSYIGDVSQWDTSSVTDTRWMFASATFLNGNVSRWDMSGARDMNWMFYEASSYNGDFSHWDTSGMRNMEGMFQGATTFNHDINFSCRILNKLRAYLTKKLRRPPSNYWKCSHCRVRGLRKHDERARTFYATTHPEAFEWILYSGSGGVRIGRQTGIFFYAAAAWARMVDFRAHIKQSPDRRSFLNYDKAVHHLGCDPLCPPSDSEAHHKVATGGVLR
jgi:surface protein